jgi:hypothetical protein
MDIRDELARVRDEANRAEFAIRREEQRMTEVERALEREMQAFEADELETERRIDAWRRREHWGHQPERPSAWNTSRRADKTSFDHG